MSNVKYVDRLPNGWFVLAVMRKRKRDRARDWVALLVDVHPEDYRAQAIVSCANAGLTCLESIGAGMPHGTLFKT